MNAIDYYSKFSIKSSIISKINPLEIKDEDWLKNDDKNTLLGWSKVLPLEKEFWVQEPLLKLVSENFKVLYCGLIQFNPYKCYLWHKDHYRGLSINLLLNHADSHCLFAKKDNTIKSQAYIKELKYEKDCFYLFNTQEFHEVINFGTPRFLFTLDFELDKTKLSYNDVKEWALENNLIDFIDNGH